MGVGGAYWGGQGLPWWVGTLGAGRGLQRVGGACEKPWGVLGNPEFSGEWAGPRVVGGALGEGRGLLGWAGLPGVGGAGVAVGGARGGAWMVGALG